MAWKEKQEAEKTEHEMRQQLMELETKAADVREGAAIRQLRRTAKQLLKGELGLRIEVWRMSTLCAKMEHHRALQVKIETQRRAENEGMGMRRLQWVLARMTKGVVAGCVTAWKGYVQRAKSKEDLARLSDAVNTLENTAVLQLAS